MEIIGYICAMLIGISLGILGSGGSILTVPILVYLFGINPVSAIPFSLFVVGITSAIGCLTYIRKNLVDIKTASIFALPSILAVFLTRYFLMPAIPNPVIETPSLVLSKEFVLMAFFALLMIIVAYNMILNAEQSEPKEYKLKNINYWRLIFIGFISGILTGLFGVGGGFIIIPALVLYANIPIRMSVGTSLLIISLNSLSGFLEEVLNRHETINYKFLLLFTLLSVAGIFIGLRVTLNLRPAQLKKIFGWFVLVIGVTVFIKEILFH